MFRRHAAPFLGALARLSSTAVPSHQSLVIPAEVAQLVSQRTAGLAVMPADVAAAIDQAASDANRKAVKRRGQELSYRLRHMSRSKHRGGVHPNLSDRAVAGSADEDEDLIAARRQRRGKRRQSRHQALEQLTRSAALPVNAAQSKASALEHVLGPLRGVVDAEEAAQAAAERESQAARSSISDGGSLYDTHAALAYAASRMPACYAALEAALREVAARRPGWRPDSMLDFGAGPGTAVWAAQQVWRHHPLDALAVEPAGAMSWLGCEIQQRQRQQYEAAVQRQGAEAAARASSSSSGDSSGGGAGREVVCTKRQGAGGRAGSKSTSSWLAAQGDQQQGYEEEGSDEEAEELPAPPPRLRWMHRLPPRYRAAQGRRYDLITAGYVLGELRGDAQRRRLVRDLWDRTAPGGVLLLLEPGTPAGSAHIQQARIQLLEAARQQSKQTRGGEAVVTLDGGSSSAGAAVDEGAVGAHVVAPCPHDGTCPMQTRTAWCHFVQRFQRTQLQRSAKATAGIQPRTYQDERYSYVAIAKAPRPAVHEEVAQPLIAGSFMPDLSDPQEAVQMPDHLVARKVPEDGRPIKLYTDSEEEGEEGELDDDWWDSEEETGDESGLTYSSSSSSDNSSSSSSGTSESDSWSETEGEEEEEEKEGLSGAIGSDQLRQQLTSGLTQVSTGDQVMAGSSNEQLDGMDDATRRLLFESILEGEEGDGDEESSAELAERLHQDLAAVGAQQHLAASTTAASRRPGSIRVAAPVLAPVSEATADLLLEGERVDWEEQEPAAVEAAVRASGGWSRVIRTPRKRSGHVVLDLCSAAPLQQGGQHGTDSKSDSSSSSSSSRHQQQEGVLLRQVVSRAAARRDAGGTAAYRLARRLRWGDLWPRGYQERFSSGEAPAGQH